MKPVLFPSTAKQFQTQGIGSIDCMSCTVTEERNGVFEVAVTVATSATHFEDCVEGNILYVIHDDTKRPQPFQIYKRSKPINGVVTVHAEHISYRLGMVVTTPFSSTNVSDALTRLKSNAVEGCEFDFWTDKASQGVFSVEEPCSIRSRLGGESGSILDAFGGGEYEWDHFTVKLYQHRGHDNGVVLRRRKNITDYTKNTTLENVYTAIVPYYVDSDGVMMLPEKVLRIQGAAAGRTVAVNLSDNFEEKPTVAQLRSAGTKYLQANGRTTVSESTKISFIALWQTEEYKNVAPLQRVRLCDTVTVVYDETDMVKTKVIKTVYNALLERYDSIELGESATNMSTAIKAITDAMTGDDVSKTEMQKALDHAAELITGGLGGYVVFNRNANGEPQEILIMDSPNKETAVNVIRMNRNGIAFSQRGYNGPFNTAWTIDSRFVADFITAGTLTANVIKAGILGDKANKNYWNMVTGEFSLAAGAKVGGANIASTTDATNAANNAVNVFDRALDQEKVFNKLTNNGKVKGIYLNKGNLYINADYIKSGTISADLIKSGTLTSADGKLRINLNDGGRGVEVKGESNKSSRIYGSGLQTYDNNGNLASVYMSSYLNVRGAGNTIGADIDGAIQVRAGSVPNGIYGNTYFGQGSVQFYGDVKNSTGGTQFVSDRKQKNAITDLESDNARGFIMSLRPRSFKYNNGTSGRFHHGFIAQEVYDAMEGEDWGVYTETEDEGEKVCCIRPDEIIADLVAVVQDQQKRINALEERMGV